MNSKILQQTPDTAEDFDRLLPLHLEATKITRQASALDKLPMLVSNNKFFGANGNFPLTRVYGFNANGKPTIGPALVKFSSSQPLGLPMFYVNGVITGNPFSINSSATEVQYVGIQITYEDFLLDIKEPYVRM